MNDTEVCNYADDTTLYVGDKNLMAMLAKLEKERLLSSKWFSKNVIILNEDKWHLLIFGAKEQGVTINIGTIEGLESESQKLLGVVIDSRLNFSQHVNQLCMKASQKLYAIARVSNYMDKDKVKLIM